MRFAFFLILMGSYFIGISQIFSLQYDANGNQTSKRIEGTVSEAAIQGPGSICLGGILELIASGGESYQWNLGVAGNTLEVSPQISTTYRVTVTDENGCSAVVYHYVEVLSPPGPFDIEGGLYGTSGGVPASYSISTPNSGSSYYWSISGGYILSGYGTPEIEVQWTADSLGFVRAVEQNEAGCLGDTVTLEVVLTSRQDVPLSSGWNLISTFLALPDPSPAVVFSGLQGNLIKVKNIQEVFDPNAPPVFNTLTEISAGQGYWVKVNQADELILYGRPVDAYNTPIHLLPGWNLIGYTWSESQRVEVAFAAILPILEKVKDIFRSYDPDVSPIFNTLTTIEPGRGYWVKVTEEAIFYFPDPEEEGLFAPEMAYSLDEGDQLKNFPKGGWEVKAYPNSTIAYGFVTLNGKPVPGGTMIGAFVDGECRALGSVKNQSDSSFVSFVVNGEFPEKVEFIMAHRGQVYTSGYSITSQPGVPFTYLLPISFDNRQANDREAGVQMDLFPNPTTGDFTIEIQLETATAVTLRIFNQEGRIVADLGKHLLTSGQHIFRWDPSREDQPPGVYLVQAKGDGFNLLKKITFQK